MSQTRNYPQVAVTMHTAMHNEIKQAATDRGMPKSTLIQKILHNWMVDEGIRSGPPIEIRAPYTNQVR